LLLYEDIYPRQQHYPHLCPRSIPTHGRRNPNPPHQRFNSSLLRPHLLPVIGTPAESRPEQPVPISTPLSCHQEIGGMGGRCDVTTSLFCFIFLRSAPLSEASGLYF
jgi:hypothetical protein